MKKIDENHHLCEEGQDIFVKAKKNPNKPIKCKSYYYLLKSATFKALLVENLLDFFLLIFMFTITYNPILT